MVWRKGPHPNPAHAEAAAIRTANATSSSAASTKLKHFRRIATRFEKLARNYLAAVLLASTRLSTRLNELTT